MSNQYYIKDWEGFVEGQHTYIVTTGEDDSWVADYPIFEAVEANIAVLANRAYGNEYLMNKYMDWADWLESIHVECHGWIVAEFDRLTWEWRTLSRGTMPPLQD